MKTNLEVVDDRVIDDLADKIEMRWRLSESQKRRLRNALDAWPDDQPIADFCKEADDKLHGDREQP